MFENFESLRKYQGPALYAWNNGVFKKVDWGSLYVRSTRVRAERMHGHVSGQDHNVVECLALAIIDFQWPGQISLSLTKSHSKLLCTSTPDPSHLSTQCLGTSMYVHAHVPMLNATYLEWGQY